MAAAAKTKSRGRGGRPTKYKPEMAAAFEAELAKGYSVLSAAAAIGITKPTVYEWAKRHPEFSSALKAGQAKSARWWEATLQKIAREGGGNATAAIFALKNLGLGAWRDKQEYEVAGPDGGPVKIAKIELVAPNERDG